MFAPQPTLLGSARKLPRIEFAPAAEIAAVRCAAAHPARSDAIARGRHPRARQ